MRSFWVVLTVCLLEGVALALLLADRPAASPAAVAATPRAAPPRPAATFTLVAGGDVALAGEPRAALFAGIRRYLRPADLAIANLEGTLATGGGARCTASAKAGCFVFRASPQWAAALERSGFTAMNVANNHALDFGRDAQAETLAALRGAHLAVDGLPGQITEVRAGGVRLALVGAAPYTWAQSLLDVPGTQALVRRAARRADVVSCTCTRAQRVRARSTSRAASATAASRAATRRRSPTRWSMPAPTSFRVRPPRPARHRVVPAAADRVQPRQPRDEPHALDAGRPRAERPPPRHARRARPPRRGLARAAAARRLGHAGVRRVANERRPRPDVVARGLRCARRPHRCTRKAARRVGRHASAPPVALTP